MSDVDLRVDWCEARAARYAVEKWHYSHTLPANRSNYFGIWENSRFVGVIIFGLGASPSLGKPYGLDNFEFCELTRVALDEHKTPVTKLIAIALKMLRGKNPGIRLCISFADPFHDHIGAIYQAGNWIFTGVTDSGAVYVLRDGSISDPRRYNGHGHNAPKRVPLGAQLIKTPGKYRYLYPLDRAMRRQIESLRKPYPKRGQGVQGDTPAVQVGEPGSSPGVRSELYSEVSENG